MQKLLYCEQYYAREDAVMPFSLIPDRLFDAYDQITPELLRKVADSTNIINSNPRALDADEIYDILIECR